MKKYFFAAILFISACLLFQIQLIAAKIMLPKLGGAPTVWATSMVFFQSVLLLGYGYANYVTSRICLRNQLFVQFALISVAAAMWPDMKNAISSDPTGWHPLIYVLYFLAAYVGAGFFLLSTTTPLLQSWYGKISAADDNPYVLYAASNAGSFFGLLSYPVLIEPLLSLDGQARLMTYGFAIYGGAVIAAMGIMYLRAGGKSMQSIQADGLNQISVTWQRKMEWVLSSFIPASLMLSLITYITTDIAAIPLVWVGVLAIYLLTFIIVFSGRYKPEQSHLTNEMIYVAIAVLAVPFIGFFIDKWLIIALYVLFFFAVAMVFHGHLSSIKPQSGQAAEYYMYLAVGGALASFFNGLVSPLLLPDVYEFGGVLLLALWFAPRSMKNNSSIHDIVLPAILGTSCWVLAYFGYHQLWPEMKKLPVLEAALCAVFCLFLLRWRLSRLRFVIGALAMALVGHLVQNHDIDVIEKGRNFFGVVKVSQETDPQRHILYHGTTIHGIQVFGSNHDRQPQTYYTRIGPLGDLIRYFAPDLAAYPIAVAGLGAGSVACYAAPNQNVDFFEIDPQVVEIAQNPDLFTYLKSCPANIILGDARLNISKQPDGKYGLIILDTFSSDAIPVHMITKEAFEVFQSKLAPGGIIAVHISNRYFNLEPVIGAISGILHKPAAIKQQNKISDEEKNSYPAWSASRWAVILNDQQKLQTLVNHSQWREISNQPDYLWTDQYSSILSVLQ